MPRRRRRGSASLSASTSFTRRARRRPGASVARRLLFRAALAALLGLAAPAAWSACADMAGGHGGPGAVAKGGVGGTGAPATLGVVGTITEFASVCVNGLEIHYDTATPVTVNGRPAAAGQLALGQVVAVEAAPDGERLA